MGGDKASHDPVAEYVSRVDPLQRQVVEGLRHLILNEAPSASKGLRWSHLCYSSNRNICYIAADVGHVKLGFFRGGNLRDPERLLEGTGKEMRHIKVGGPGDIREKASASLVREATDIDRSQR